MERTAGGGVMILAWIPIVNVIVGAMSLFAFISLVYVYMWATDKWGSARISTVRPNAGGDVKLKRGTRVSVTLEGSILNPVYGNGEIVGYRLTDRKRPSFWFVVPTYAITVKDK